MKPSVSVYVSSCTQHLTELSELLCFIHLLHGLPQLLHGAALDDPHIDGGEAHPLGDLLGVQLLKVPKDQYRAAALIQRKQQLCHQVTALHHFGSLPGRPIREFLPVLRQFLQAGNRLLIPIILLQPVFGDHIKPGRLAVP